MSRETISLARFALFNQAQVTTIEGLSLLFLLALQSHKSRLRRGDEPLVFQSLPDCHWQARQCYVATGSIFKQLDQSMQTTAATAEEAEVCTSASSCRAIVRRYAAYSLSPDGIS